MRGTLALAVLLLGTTCFADSVGLFDIEGTLGYVPSGNFAGTFAGTIEVNTTTGSIVGWSITMPFILSGFGDSGMNAFTFTPSNSQSGVYGGTANFQSYSQFFNLSFSVPNNTFIGFNGSAFQGDYFNPRSLVLDNYSVSGTIGAVAPEPSSLLLMGSGLTGMFAFRRKLFGSAWAGIRRMTAPTATTPTT